MTKKHPPSPFDDLSDWKAYTQGVKKVYSPKAIISAPQKPIEVKAIEPKPLPITSHGSLAYNKPKKHSRPQHIDRTLDMHGMTRDLAFAALEKCILRAWYEGDLTIRVITGKGISTPFNRDDDLDLPLYQALEQTPRGILREMLPQWLEHTHLRAYVSYYAPAKSPDGGSGAFYIVLKKKIKGM